MEAIVCLSFHCKLSKGSDLLEVMDCPILCLSHLNLSQSENKKNKHEDKNTHTNNRYTLSDFINLQLMCLCIDYTILSLCTKILALNFFWRFYIKWNKAK